MITKQAPKVHGLKAEARQLIISFFVSCIFVAAILVGREIPILRVPLNNVYLFLTENIWAVSLIVGSLVVLLSLVSGVIDFLGERLKSAPAPEPNRQPESPEGALLPQSFEASIANRTLKSSELPNFLREYRSLLMEYSDVVKNQPYFLREYRSLLMEYSDVVKNQPLEVLISGSVLDIMNAKMAINEKIFNEVKNCFHITPVESLENLTSLSKESADLVVLFAYDSQEAEKQLDYFSSPNNKNIRVLAPAQSLGNDSDLKNTLSERKLNWKPFSSDEELKEAFISFIIGILMNYCQTLRNV
jgi:hypothetical protein